MTAVMLASPPLVDDFDSGEAFTRTLTIPETGRRLSAIIATYNRCPFDPATRLNDNPLTWALDSLLSQDGSPLAEIVVVDDGSTDHTPAVLDRYQNGGSPVPVVVHRFADHQGTAAARNTAVRLARTDWLLFGDDDCVYRPHFAAGAAYLLHRLRGAMPNAAAVMLPFYYRALRPRDVYPVARIGRLDPAQGRFSTRFHAWPAEYGNSPPRLAGCDLVAPLPVDLIGGTAVLDAAALSAAGGFVDLSAWRSSYSDHLHLSADLTDAGAALFFCPDPRLAAVHLKYGAAGRFLLDTTELAARLPGVGRTLGELVGLSSVPRTDTGARCDDAGFHEEMIGSFFAFFAGRSLTGGLAWAVRTWREFVQAGQVYSLTVTDIPDRAERVAAWRCGLRRGAAFLTHQARPRRARPLVAQLLGEICARLGQPPISGW
jgi:hypothetical protein